MNKFNKEQQQAIESKNNVLVSAGAGSGKTTVLVRRVLHNIIENNIDIDEFLILTFTNDASISMKEKIKTKLLLENKLDQINKIDKAHIETFDAFAYYLVNKYGYRINLSNNITVLEEDILNVKVKQIIDDIVLELVNNPTDLFIDFTKTYLHKDLSKLKDILKVNFFNLIKLNSPDDFLNEYEARFSSIDSINKSIDEYFNFIKEDIKKIIELSDYCDESRKTIIQEKYKPVIEYNHENFINFFSLTFKKTTDITNSKKNDDFEIINEIIEIHKEIQSKFKDINFSNLEICINNINKFSPFIIELLKKINEEVNKFLKKVSSYTFTQIANFALRILKENKDIADELKNKIKLIFVDEYQDTSNEQEELISLISNDNVFVVGDVKQSIYLFRKANPDNFIKKYEDYLNCNNGLNNLINMNSNYRSHENVISFINELFTKLMVKEFGGVTYKNYHELESKNENLNNSSNKIDSEFYYGTYKVSYNKDEDYYDKLVNIIKYHFIKYPKIYDGLIDDFRDLKYSDFAILSRKSVNFSKIVKKFEESDIPINPIYDINIISDEVIYVLISFLKLIDIILHNNGNINIVKEDKHFFVSVLRSYLYEINDKDIYEMIINNTYKDNQIYKKIVSFAKENNSLPLDELYIEILNQFNFISNLSKLSNPYDKIQIFEQFYNKVKIMSDLSYSLNDFIQYLEVIDEADLSIKCRIDNSGEDAVLLTTIHKSKGLQYKIVILVDLASEFNKIVNFDINNGLDIKSTFFNKNTNFKNEIYKINQLRKEKEEYIRLLYVALTRSEQKTIMMLENKDNKKSIKLEDCKSMQDFIDYSNVNIKEFKLENITENIPTDNNFNENSSVIYDIKELPNIKYKEIIKKKASKIEVDNIDIKKLDYGTYLHELFESINFNTLDISHLEGVKEYKYIKNILENDFFDELKSGIFYKEYAFRDYKNNVDGVIDLLVIKNNEAYIIDYKSKNIDDEEYKNQLKSYKEYVENIFNKKPRCYLISIIDNKIIEVIYD